MSMSNRYERMEKFLFYISDLVLQNKKAFLNKGVPVFPYHFVYDRLIKFDVSDDEKNIYIENDPAVDFHDKDDFFSMWQERFEHKKNISCIVDEYWSYFCQFKNKGSNSEHIKIYLPLDSKHLYEGANKIFDYLSSENMKHLSKIGKEMRFDNIVIRLLNSEDAKKVLDFIKNDSYIQEGLILANPFAFQQDDIALACDGSESYNRTISLLIENYFKSKKNSVLKNKDYLSDVSLSDFINFCKDKYNEVKGNESKEMEFTYKFFQAAGKHESKNYMQIMELFLKGLDPEFTFDDYIDLFESHLDEYDLDSEKKSVFKSILKNIYNKQNKLYEQGLVELNGEVAASTALAMFLNYNDSEIFSKLGESTERFNKLGIDFSTVMDFMAYELIINKYNVDDMYNASSKSELYSWALEYVKVITSENAKTIENSDKKEVLDECIVSMYEQYQNGFKSGKYIYDGTNLTTICLKRYIESDEYALFTRTEDVRKKIMDSEITGADIFNIMCEDLNYERITNPSEKVIYSITNEYVEKQLENHIKKADQSTLS